MKNSGIKLLMIVVLLWGYPVFGANWQEQNLPLNYIIKTKVPVRSIDVIASYPHDRDAYTQGLLVRNGFLYESTGLHGKSGIFKKDIKTGKILQEIRMEERYFGEGIVIFQDKIYQLTWQDETMILYDLHSLREIRKINYQGEGWGLATNGRYIYMSNGSSTISVRDPKTFRILREMVVRDGDTPVERINEMEFIHGEIWANIYMEDLVVRFSPKNGKVKGWLDLSILRSYLPAHTQVDVINGIAYDKDSDRIFVTGKLWPKLFEIKIKENKIKKP